jgi:hypothetical protein
VARRIALHIIQSVERLLPDDPQIGRAGRVPGTRELVIARTPYIIPYRFSARDDPDFLSTTELGGGLIAF